MLLSVLSLLLTSYLQYGNTHSDKRKENKYFYFLYEELRTFKGIKFLAFNKLRQSRMEHIQDNPWKANDKNAKFKMTPLRQRNTIGNTYTESKTFSLPIVSTMSSCTYLYSHSSVKQLIVPRSHRRRWYKSFVKKWVWHSPLWGRLDSLLVGLSLSGSLWPTYTEKDQCIQLIDVCL